jgi:uncharacterized protein YggE
VALTRQTNARSFLTLVALLIVLFSIAAQGQKSADLKTVVVFVEGDSSVIPSCVTGKPEVIPSHKSASVPRSPFLANCRRREDHH